MAVRNRRLAPALTLALFVALAVAHTWPLAADPARWSRNDNADTILNEWIVAWVAHQTVTSPRHLFDANIFYPEHRTLAFSEHLFVPAMMGAPLFWLGASPVLVFNLLLLAGFALTGWTMGLVVTRWTDDIGAGIVAGSLLAFNAHTLTRLPHLQAQHVEFLPLALLAFDSLLRAPRWRTAILLAVCVSLQGLSSNYLLVFTMVALAVSLLVRPEAWRAEDRARLATMIVGATILAAVVMIPFLIPYYLARRDQGLSRSLEEVALYSAGWRDYLATAGTLHFRLWSERFFQDVTPLFPGVTALVLSVIALKRGRTPSDVGPAQRRYGFFSVEPRTRMFAAIGLAGVLLSFGPALPGYSALYRVVPLLQGVRGAARFGYLLLVAVAALAGFGVARLRVRWAGRPWLNVACVGLVFLVNVEAWRAPLTYRPFGGIPRVYQSLAADTHAVVAEFPFFPPEGVFRNAEYMLNATSYWRPLLNGYSGFTPASYVEHSRILREFPAAESIAPLRGLGVTHVVVHLEMYEPAAAAEMTSNLQLAKELILIAEENGIRVYRVSTH